MSQKVTWWRPKPQDQALLVGHRCQLHQLDSDQGWKGWAQWRSSLVTHGQDLLKELGDLQEVGLGAKELENPSGTGGKPQGWLRSLLNSLKAGRQAKMCPSWKKTRLGSQVHHRASPSLNIGRLWTKACHFFEGTNSLQRKSELCQTLQRQEQTKTVTADRHKISTCIYEVCKAKD